MSYIVCPDGTVAMIERDDEHKAHKALIDAVDSTRQTIDGYKKN